MASSHTISDGGRVVGLHNVYTRCVPTLSVSYALSLYDTEKALEWKLDKFGNPCNEGKNCPVIASLDIRRPQQEKKERYKK
jgi:hypothetical protein